MISAYTHMVCCGLYPTPHLILTVYTTTSVSDGFNSRCRMECAWESRRLLFIHSCAHDLYSSCLPPISPMVVVTVLENVMFVSPAALNQRLYRSSSLPLPPVDTGSSQASVSVVLDISITLTLSGGDGGTAWVCV